MRILVIEDETALGRFMKAGLEAECYAVDLAVDGEKGFSLACMNDYDLVVLDNMLPGKDGPSICRDLRAKGKTVPILLVSVQSDVGRKVELLNLGADDYLSKPFSFSELSARIKALLRRPRQMESTTLHAGDLVLDREKFLVTRAERRLHLTNKEFDLLEYLLRNQGRVLSRSMIIEHVWDLTGDLFSNTLETHIMNLRRKIGRPGAAKLIHTVPGRGYILDPDL